MPSSVFLRVALPALIPVLLSSCAQNFYRPRPLDPPMLDTACQVKVTGLITSNALYFSGAWSPVNSLGIQAGINGPGSTSNSVTGNGGSVSNSESRTHYFVSAGYYQQTVRKLHFEVYGGVGRAQYRHSGDLPVRRLVFANYFLQPALVVKDKNVRAALALRYDYLRRTSTELNPAATLNYEGVHRFLRYDGYQFLQPGLTICVGNGGVQGHVGFSSSFVLNKDYETVYGGDFYQHGTLRIAFGLNLQLEKLFATQKGR